MPTPESILEGLETLAEESVMVAMAWHALVALGLGALLFGFRPDRRLATLALAAPLGSVAVLAWMAGGAFNAVAFALLAIVAVSVASRSMRSGPVRVGSTWAAILGVLLVAFGWFYPHFLDAPLGTYAVAAPMGVLPCPTLALVGGIALLLDGLQSRSLTGTLCVASLFYGLFGAFQLGVWMDLGLLVGAIGLFVLTIWPRPEEVGFYAHLREV